MSYSVASNIRFGIHNGRRQTSPVSPPNLTILNERVGKGYPSDFLPLTD